MVSVTQELHRRAALYAGRFVCVFLCAMLHHGSMMSSNEGWLTLRHSHSQLSISESDLPDTPCLKWECRVCLQCWVVRCESHTLVV
jgi:hypothetical protein